MYSFLSSARTFTLKSNVHEQIFSLLGNAGKTLLSEGIVYAEVSTTWYEKAKSLASDIWYSPIKRILTYTAIVLASVTLAPPGTSFAATSGTSQFIVTAYYSPLPGQSFYLKGNYDAEVRLNGNGTHGASGAPVFTGMIAAPKSYAFGTQIFFEGLGVGTVSDRGGAIVDAGVRGQAYDRIDLWMGQGEAGLKRAMAWGRRVVTGTIMESSTTKNMNPIDISGIDNGRVNLGSFPSASAGGSSGLSSEIISHFADLGYTPVNGNTSAMVLQFQLDRGVIQSSSEDGAGNYGPKTKAALKVAHAAYESIRETELKAIEKARQEMFDERVAWQTRYDKAHSSVLSFSGIKKGDNNSNVLALQSLLASEGFYSGKKTGQMKSDTLAAIKKYQKARGIKQTGTIDSATQTAMITDMLEA